MDSVPRGNTYAEIADMLPSSARWRPRRIAIKSIEITVWGPKQDADLMKRYEDLGVSRVVFNLESEKADTILPVIEGWTKLMRQVNG
jgi:hypothetical protein